MDIRFRVGQQGPRNDFSRSASPVPFDVDEHAREQERLAGSAVGSEFLVTLAHELRTPLTSLRASFDMLKDPQTQSMGRQNLRSLLDNMDRGIARLERQVTDLLEAGYLRAGVMELRRQTTNLEGVVAEALSEVSGAASWRKVAVDVSVDDDLPEVSVDPGRLAQVISNLLSNAIKFSPTAGDVRLRIRFHHSDDDPIEDESNADVPTTNLDDDGPGALEPRVVMRVPEIVVQISDEGPGIGPELHRKIFQPFYRIRAEANDDGVGAGAGLGLTIAYELVRLHGGRMWVRSERGAGTEIGFAIPVSGAT